MDSWYFPRAQLADQYLKTFKIGISSNLAIVAPRRKGKTLFLLHDISHRARSLQYLPVYASLWQNINAPHEGLIMALEEALEGLEKQLPFSRILKTQVRKVSLGNELIGKVGLEFADQPESPSSRDLIRLDQLLTELQKKAKTKTVLLLIDEVQHLATSPHFDALTHALRTMLDKRSGEVKALFTGSSRHYMNLLFNVSQSPFYHFVETRPFPDLGSEFISFLLEKLNERQVQAISKAKLWNAFEALDQSPYWMMKLVSHIMTFDESLKTSLAYVLQLIEVAEGFESIAKRLKPIDKIVFLALSSGESPFSKVLLQKIDRETAVKGLPANVQRSLNRLTEQNLVSQLTKGEYHIEKPGLKEYLLKRKA